jgi:membrane protein YqaA with SNARE-associated domain
MTRRAADAIVNSSIIMQICLKKSKTAVKHLAVATITAFVGGVFTIDGRSAMAVCAACGNLHGSIAAVVNGCAGGIREAAEQHEHAYDS